MGDPQNPNTDKPCEICGHVGWVDPLTICSKCKVTREHIYCMRVACVGDQEKWVCEECDSSNQIPSLIPASRKQPTGTGMKFVIKKPPQNSKVQYLTPEEAIGLESGAMRSNLSSPSKSYFGHRPSVNRSSSTLPAKLRIKPNPPVGPSGHREPLNDWCMPSSSKENYVFQKEHAWKGSSVSRRSSATSMQTSNAMLRKEIAGSAPQHYGESPTAKRVTFGKLPKTGGERDNITSDHTSVQLGQCLPVISSDGRAQQFCIDTRTAKHSPDGKLSKDDINSGCTSQLVQPSPTVTSGIDVCTEAQPKKIDSKERESPRATMVTDCYLPNHPAVSPTWKGTFQITNDVKLCSIFDDIQAHPPCKVHRKVYKVSKQFPKTLPFEVLPRKDSWEDIFEDDVPSELDIGLYFLSSRMSNLNGEQSYCSLLKYVDEHDFLLRTCFDEVELLVFSSKHLPVDSRKINQKHFLWGLLRPSKANIVASKENLLAQDSEVKDKIAEPSRVESLAMVDVLHSSDNQQLQQLMSEEHEAEDMDVDMLGGNELGNIDRVVPKPTDNASGDHIKGEIEPSNEVKPSPKSAGSPYSPIKIKREWTGGNMEASYSSSCVENEVLEFHKELQRSFDRLSALMQAKEAGCLKRDVKVEADA